MKKLDSTFKAFSCLVGLLLLGTGNLMAQPANDDCTGATMSTVVIDGGTTIITGDATGATDGPGFGFAHVWEAFTLDACADVTIDYCDTQTNDLTNVFVSLADCPVTAAINGDAEQTTCANGSYTITWSEVPAGTYYFAVMADAGAGGVGPYTINVTATACPVIPAPANDAICDATDVAVGSTVTATNESATPDGIQASCWSDADVENDIWFTFTAPASGEVNIETINTGDNDDTQVAVYSSADGTCTGGLTEVGCNDDISGTDYMSLVELTGLTAGDTYWVNVDGWQGTSGEFDLSIMSPIVPGFCDGSTAIICDDFEGYTLGTIQGQAAHWDGWTAGSTDVATVTDYRSFSGSQSAVVGVGPSEDSMLKFGDRTSGNWTVSWMMYIPSDSTGYYNFQTVEDPNPANWILNVLFNEDGTNPGVINITNDENPATSVGTGAYPSDEWFEMSHSVDVDNGTMSIAINGVDIITDFDHNAAPANGDNDQLGGVNFYANGAENTYYIDNVMFDGMESPQACDFGDIDQINMALICDDIDSYTAGGLTGQAEHWSSWGGTAADEMIVTTDYAFSGSNSIQVIGGVGMDGVLRLGDQMSGVYGSIWKMYIPAGKSAYFNIQDNQDINPATWNGTVFFNDGNVPAAGEGTIIVDENAPDVIAGTFTYPEDQWFTVVMLVDLDSDVLELRVNGELVVDDFPYAGNLGGINFYPGSADHEYYLDDVAFGTDLTITVNEEGKDVFSMFPNPTAGLVTISSLERVESITVTNMLGAVVSRDMNMALGNIEVDLSGVETGLYMMTIEVDGKFYTQRVMKK